MFYSVLERVWKNFLNSANCSLGILEKQPQSQPFFKKLIAFSYLLELLHLFSLLIFFIYIFILIYKFYIHFVGFSFVLMQVYQKVITDFRNNIRILK